MYSINTHTLRWVACWQRVKRILMSLVHAAKHKDKANRSTLPTCSCFKCLLKVNKSWDTNCTCKYLKKHSNRAERMNEGGTMKRGMRSIKIIQSVSNQYSCYILILKGVVKTGDGWEATWRNREFSPELHYDLLTERERDWKENMSSHRSESEYLNVWFVTQSCDSSLCFSKSCLGSWEPLTTAAQHTHWGEERHRDRRLEEDSAKKLQN